MTELEGSVVLVVGASGVLGAEIARLLETKGATVVRAGRNPDHLAGPDTLLGDLTDETAAATLVAAAVSAHDRLDGVVIAAGVVAFGPASEVTDETLRRLFEVNALAPIRLIREVSPHLAASATAGGKPFIVTMSGIVSETPTAGLAAYSAAKAALAAFVQAGSRELRRSGIRVLDARPGHTETGLATRAIAGTAPAFPPGLDPSAVAQRIVRGIVDDEKDLPSGAF
ncbi:SDR family NAD(P)-dependent oxidoreductase [Glaciihabitans sp. GrIS 2.15]|uniref:SDR family NAD(P)-dependent oxidoreductase n=1 Tax=Glaciihabitans sp. GrIS 2.15 TaxID=3071710 RepID=UPI002DFB0B4E|nr:NAD(P)-dependent dehydrogenase (short-subunit alcohol dehydrogenase family) [Glaciihabitans sp. GrIS 2.15]